jgi:zinc transport system substrate-binding protein
MNPATVAVMAGLGALAMAPAVAAADPPRVVTTIKPVHSLVAGVMAGVGEPTLLLDGAGSPHGHSLRPSQARALSQSEVVFWIGPELEAFMVRSLASLVGDAEIVALAAVPGLTRLPTREAGVWGPDQGAGQGDPDHGHTDMHLWLDPRNAEAMTRAIVAALATADPGNAARYDANGAALGERLQALDQALATRLAPVRERPFVVLHDAYQYLERRYDLNAVGAITVDPERRPGARRLREIRDRLQDLEAACVFSEPQLDSALVATIVEGTDARTAELDPLGAALDPGPDHYFQLMNRLADALIDCSSPPSAG